MARRRHYRRNPGMSSGEIIGLAALGVGAFYLMQQTALQSQTLAANTAVDESAGSQISSVLTAGGTLVNSLAVL